MNPSLNKYLPRDELDLLPWNFISRSVDSVDKVNPRRAIDAPLRESVEDVIREVMEGINTLSKERGRVIDFKDLLYGYYRVNPQFGVDYILDLLLIYKKYRGRKMMFPVRRHAYLQQPFGPLVLRRSPNVRSQQRIHFILPLAGRLPVFERFMDNFRRVCLEPGENVRLVVVLYPTAAADDPLQEIKELVATYRQRFQDHVTFKLDVIERTESFARASALELGASSCGGDGDDCLLVFMDVDMVFEAKTLDRIRTHTIRNQQAYFPIVFSQFDPSFEDDNAEVELDDAHSSVFDIDEDRGYWRFYGFGIASLYRSDLLSVGGMNVSIRGWGQEDVDLYDRVVHSNLTVFRAPDPGLVHVFHPIKCDAQLEPKQRTMCLGTRTNTYASQRRLARYWMDHHPSAN